MYMFMVRCSYKTVNSMRTRTQPTMSLNSQHAIYSARNIADIREVSCWMNDWSCVSGLSLQMLSVCWESFGPSERLLWARSQWSSTTLLFNTLSLHCILRCWHIKIKLLAQAQNLHLYARIKCSFLAEKMFRFTKESHPTWNWPEWIV